MRPEVERDKCGVPTQPPDQGLWSTFVQPFKTQGSLYVETFYLFKCCLEFQSILCLKKVSRTLLETRSEGRTPAWGVYIDPCLRQAGSGNHPWPSPPALRPFHMLCVIHFHSVCLHQPVSVPAGLRSALSMQASLCMSLPRKGLCAHVSCEMPAEGRNEFLETHVSRSLPLIICY